MRGFRNPDCGIVGSCVLNYWLLRVQLDDQMLVYRGSKVATRRHGFESAFQRLRVDFKPFGETAALGRFRRGLDAKLFLRLGRDFDHVARTKAEGWDVHALAVDEDGVVAHHLTRFAA